MKDSEVKNLVKKRYGKIAVGNSGGCCCGSGSSCCGSAEPAADISLRIGYKDTDLNDIPDGANLGLGCGNPLALVSLKAGETVLDLGSGAGFDCFLAAKKVGESGRIIGVDMTPEMVEKATDNARRNGFTNVEFRQGEIDKLPIADSSVDVIISNCVINLVPDKEAAFKEAFRVLKPGGRLVVSDIVLLKMLPEVIVESLDAYAGCVSGAVMKDSYLRAIAAAGFENVSVVAEKSFPIDFIYELPGIKAILSEPGIESEKLLTLDGSVMSVTVSAFKTSA